MIPALAVIAAVAAVGNWVATARDDRRLDWITKPVATTALLLVAVVADDTDGAVRPWWIVALVCCLAGDVLLMLPWDLFVLGLVAFLLGHLAFVVGLARMPAPADQTLHTVLGVALVALAGALVAPRIVRAVRATEPALVGPVLAYIAVISAMVLTAAVRGDGWAFLGASSFYVSDAVLAWDRFVQPRRALAVAVMVTYHAALAGLVLSFVR